MLLLTLCIILVGSSSVKASEVVEPQRDVWIDSGFVFIEATLNTTADSQRCWQVLTDFEGMSRYLPQMDSSYVVERAATDWTVQQVFTTRLVLPWTFRTLLTYAADTEKHHLQFRQISGSLHDYSGSWRLTSGSNGRGTRLSHRARARLRHPVPGLVVRYIVRRHLDQMLGALHLRLEETGASPVAHSTASDGQRAGSAQ